MLQGEHFSILLTCIKPPFVTKIFVLSFIKWPLYLGYTVLLFVSATKVTENIAEVADLLGASAIIVQDLSQRIMNNYKFSWERALKMKSDSAIFLQYAHARLCK